MSERNITGRIHEGPATEKVQYVRGTERNPGLISQKKEDYTMVAVLLVLK